MTQTRDKLIQTIWKGRDPFANFPANLYRPDHQGWNSEHRYLTRAINEVGPSIVVEIGVWKGGSVKTMARHLKSSGADAVIIAIDTWLGSSDHWIHGHQDQMSYRDGYPCLYHTFVSNIFDADLQDYVLPIPLDSVNAFDLINFLQITPDVIHIDAGHDLRSVTNDLEAWWPLLKAGGVLVGDDYAVPWTGVIEAFDNYFSRTPHASFESEHPKCYVRKQAA